MNKIKWHEEDQYKANNDGWSLIFNTVTNKYEIQKYGERYENNDEARSDVNSTAYWSGSHLHLKAVYFAEFVGAVYDTSKMSHEDVEKAAAHLEIYRKLLSKEMRRM